MDVDELGRKDGTAESKWLWLWHWRDSLVNWRSSVDRGRGIAAGLSRGTTGQLRRQMSLLLRVQATVAGTGQGIAIDLTIIYPLTCTPHWPVISLPGPHTASRD